MARDRLAKILEGMAAKKDLKALHYRIYLCIFSGLQDGVYHNENSLQKITNMHLRTIQKGVKELIETGNLKKDSDGFILLTFWSGFPVKVQKIEPSIQKIEPVQKGESAAIRSKQPQNDEETQSMLYHESSTKRQDHVNIELETNNKEHGKHDTRVK